MRICSRKPGKKPLSALGQKQTFELAPSHVRFTPHSGHSSVQVGCPKMADSSNSEEHMRSKRVPGQHRKSAGASGVADSPFVA